MKRICCTDCKRATKNWNYTGLLFCTNTIKQRWSWAWGKAIKHAKRCETLNVAGQCALYRPRLRKRFWDFLFASG